jgi:hypothetical protein
VALYYDSAAQELFVVDAAAHDIKVLAPDGRLRRIIGRRGRGPGEFNFPCDIAENDGLIWIVDAGNNRIQGLTRNGLAAVVFGTAGDAPGDLALPKSLAFDSDGNLYVVDARFENVQIFDQTGRLLLFFGREGIGPGEFWLPAGICIDPFDRIWICDTYNGRLQVFDYVGTGARGPRRDSRSSESGAGGPRKDSRSSEIRGPRSDSRSSEHVPICATVLRLGGIHGPGRDLGERIRRAAGQERGDGDAYVNLIHRDDIVTGLAELLDVPYAGVLNLTDGTPMKRRELYDGIITAADLPAIRWANTDTPPDLGKRIRNTLIKRTLGITLQHPSYP